MWISFERAERGAAAAPPHSTSRVPKAVIGRDLKTALIIIVESRESVEMLQRRPSPGRRWRVDVGCLRPCGRAGGKPEGVDVAP